ncbi:MAG: PD-(D/E)XK nuclease family protein [Lachnospiraceae bacterium]|nr:PD-(D/E)XK nuclease family protein [Lachnospiraceae bacterium]
MSLNLIFGPSGSGKTEYLYDILTKEASENKNKRFYLLVPEQYTMSAQRALVNKAKGHAILNIDVTSVKRLGYRVFEELGTKTFDVLEDTGKLLMLQSIIAEINEELLMIKNASGRMGYLDEIKSLLTELSQYRVSGAKLSELLPEDNNDPVLAAKLHDIKLIDEAFKNRLSGKYIMAEELTECFANVVKDSELLEGAVIAFDGFTGFTPTQKLLIEELFKKVSDVYACFTLDNDEDVFKDSVPENMFYLSKKASELLINAADNAGMEVKDPVRLGEDVNLRFREAPALNALSKSLFRKKRFKYLKSVDNEITVTAVSRPMDEVVYAARLINKLVREEGFRYRDIAIVSGDERSYGRLIKRAFKEFDIPFFLDSPDLILYDPLTECLSGILSAVSDDLSYESVCRILKSGMVFPDRKACDLFENFILARGTRGFKKYEKGFDTFDERLYTEEDFALISGVREALIKLLSPVCALSKGEKVTAKERSEALRETLSLIEIPEEKQGVFEKIEELLSKTDTFLGEEHVSAKDYEKLIMVGISALETAHIPQGFDQVLVGDIERTRLSEVKTLIFLGANEGLIPKAADEGGILSQTEREKLKSFGAELAPTASEQAFIQRFYLYLNLTKPTKRLYVTYSAAGTDGKALRPSYIIGVLKRLFPELKVKTDENDPKEDIVTPVSGKRFFIKGLHDEFLRQNNPEWAALYKWFNEHKTYENDAKKLIDAALYSYSPKKLDESIIKELYGAVLECSITRLEQYAGCAYSHFLKYGLKLSEREEYGFMDNDFGTLVHNAIEFYSKALDDNKETWTGVSKEKQQIFVAGAFEKALEQAKNKSIFDTKASEYLRKRSSELLEETVDILTGQIKSGRFTPSDYEVSFGYGASEKLMEYELFGKEIMRLRGRIDRVDTLNIPEGESKGAYVRVIDYKTGNKKFSLASVYYGRELQLIVYLKAAEKLLDEKLKRENSDLSALPAGVYYYHVAEPELDFEKINGMDEDAIADEILKACILTGATNSNPDVYMAMDKTMSPSESSKVVNIKRTKTGLDSRSSKAYSSEQFSAISGHVDGVIKKMGEEIISGVADINPKKLGDKDACTYCPYASVCRFDTKRGGMKKTTQESIKDDEIFDLISAGSKKDTE